MKPVALLRPRRILPAALLCAAALLSACASAPPPHAEMALCRAAVERAAAVAVDAPRESAAAREKLLQAQEAFDEEDYVLARQLAEQAEADAALAEAQSQVARSRRALTGLRAGVLPTGASAN